MDYIKIDGRVINLDCIATAYWERIPVQGNMLRVFLTNQKDLWFEDTPAAQLLWKELCDSATDLAIVAASKLSEAKPT